MYKMHWNLIHTRKRKLVDVFYIDHAYSDPYVRIKPELFSDDYYYIFLLKIGYHPQDYTYEKLAKCKYLSTVKKFCREQRDLEKNYCLDLDSNDDICYFLIQKKGQLVRSYYINIPLGKPYEIES